MVSKHEFEILKRELCELRSRIEKLAHHKEQHEDRSIHYPDTAPDYYNLWVSEQYRHDGYDAPSREVVVSGRLYNGRPAALLLRDAILAIIERHFAGHGGCSQAKLTIANMFEERPAQPFLYELREGE